MSPKPVNQKPAGRQSSGARRSSSVRAAKRPMGKFYAILAVIAIAGAAAIAYAASRPKQAVSVIDPTKLPAAAGHLLGRADAPIQVLEFADFECPQCGVFGTVTEPDVRERLVNTGQISYRFFDFPLEMHRNTVFAHNAAACAEEQGKFWEMHDKLFAEQTTWNGEATSRPRDLFVGYAKAIGADQAKFEACYDAQKFGPQIEANRQEAIRRGVNSTPTFIIGKRMIPGNLPYDTFKAYVDSARAEAASAAPATAPAAPAAAKS
jgi:protein-disulfide isomerase